ncbi:MAG: ATP-binding protein [Chlamydiae bacterium]|nr:ATP-binding protein [Chlamydiota bacterium]
MPIIGREKEVKVLDRLYRSSEAEFLAVYGRRRIGKTFLVHEFFKDKGLYFEITGSQSAGKLEQLKNFSIVFGNQFGKKPPIPASWTDAFELLRQTIDKEVNGRKIILFFDELPWLASKKSGFLGVLEYYWNHYFSRNPRIILIVCGSAASWMIKKVVRNKGGLHGRLTAEIRLLPFDLAETEKFLKAQKIELGRKQLLELYMAIGGVAKYLTYVKRGKSSAQNIQEICFEQGAPLAHEFHKLYISLFSNYTKHISVVETLGKNRSGMTLTELLAKTGLESGGSSSMILQELQESGFILYTHDYKKRKKDGKYRLIDEFSLFYLTWMKDFFSMNNLNKDYWLRIQSQASYNSWAGYAFEGICLKFLSKVVHGLGLDIVASNASGWECLPRSKEDRGAQIDLVIYRTDRSINLCEIKFCGEEFVIDKEYAEQLAYKKSQFRKITKTKASLFTTLITPYGSKENSHYLSCVDYQISMEALFD